MELPPGFRFHPTDEELITHYLSRKVLDPDFSPIAMVDVDMNKVEPWELPWRAKLGEKEWYFFCVRDKKYPTGLRTNRATSAGYWKATGKDKEIVRDKTLVGMKKTLVFYRGRAPKGEKSNWVCHEYRLEGKLCLENLPKSTKNDWVISRVFQKTSGGKKVHISGLMRVNPPRPREELPPLMAVKPKPEGESDYGPAHAHAHAHAHVHCFSNEQTSTFDGPSMFYPSIALDSCPAGPSPFHWLQFPTVQPGTGLPSLIQDTAILRSFLNSCGPNMKEWEMPQANEMSNEKSSVVSVVEMGRKTFQEQHLNLGCIWNY